jgi:hypothetical protein
LVWSGVFRSAKGRSAACGGSIGLRRIRANGKIVVYPFIPSHGKSMN